MLFSISMITESVEEKVCLVANPPSELRLRNRTFCNTTKSNLGKNTVKIATVYTFISSLRLYH